MYDIKIKKKNLIGSNLKGCKNVNTVQAMNFSFLKDLVITATVCAKNFHNALMYVIQFVCPQCRSYETTSIHCLYIGSGM